MIVFPKAKINLGLNVVRKRPDGFHDIESVLVPVPLCDALEAVVDPAQDGGIVAYTRSGLFIEGDLAGDLVMRAHAELARRRRLPGLRMHLHKRIPAGAGLGGGSSDGAHALLLLNDLLALGFSQDELRAMAAGLGSDCPFFIHDGPQHAMGRGEVLTPVEVPLGGLWLMLVNPGIHVSTKEAFARMVPTGRELGIAEALARNPVETWRELAPNTMEDPVIAAHPAIGQAMERMRSAGAVHVAMSGSGSTVFGLFRQEPEQLEWPTGHAAWLFPLGE